MTIYSFPKKVIETLKQFAELETAQVTELSEFIESNLESLVGPDAAFDKASKGTFTALDRAQAFAALDTLVPLLYSVLSTATDSKAAVADVVQAFRTHPANAGATDVKNVEKQLRKNLSRLFDNAKVRLKAKAMRLLSSHDKSFIDCEILSDIRPVFSTDGKVNVEAAVLFHTLRIGYGHERDSLFVAMDASDLRKLKAAIDRAIAKEECLSRFIENAGVEHVKVA